MIRVVVAGAKGRMGTRIVAMIREAADLEFAGGVDAGENMASALANADVVVDFTVAPAAAANATVAAEHGTPLVIGTTGLSADERRTIEAASRRVPVVFSPNMSVGVNVMAKLVAMAAKALGNDYRIDIVETHHVHKLDRPSGTAKRLAEAAIAAGRRSSEEIVLRSIREGEIVGDHTVTFAGPAETLAISHHAASRDIFAEGALAATRWIAGKPAGLYTMDDVLGLA